MPPAVTPSAVAFYLLAAVVLAGGVGVAFFRQLLHAALSLLVTLGGVAGLFIYLGADFLGMAQLLIYVGGILVMLLFAILLTQKIGEGKQTNLSTGRKLGIPLALGVGGTLAWLLARAAWPTTQVTAAPTTVRLGDGFLREYLLLFELGSLVLLGALVGALVLARRTLRREEAP